MGNYLAETKQYDPKQTHLHIPAPANLKYESLGLMAKNNNFYKTIWKKLKLKRI